MTKVPHTTLTFGAGWARVVEATYGTWCGTNDLLAARQDMPIPLKE